jgi:hypothetical protein
MIPVKTSSVFKSRWWALLWAAGFIWFAMDVASSQPQSSNTSVNAEQPTDAAGTPISSDDQNSVNAALSVF